MIGLGEIILFFIILFYFVYESYSFLLAVILVITVFGCLLWYLFYEKHYWLRQGVPGPKPHLFTGNAKDYENGLHTLDEKWISEYGKTYGMYLMSSPELVSMDLDILRHILVKDFEHFTDRTNLLNVNPSDEKSLLAMSLVSLKGKHWSRVRNQIAPAFSTAKIKLMIPIFNECSRICINILDQYEADGVAVPIKDVITRLTFDMTLKCAFGYDFHVQHQSSSPFFEYSKKFSEFDLRSPIVTFIILFPNICAIFQILTGITMVNHAANKFFRNVFERMFDERSSITTKYNDFFQILLDVLNKEEDELEKNHIMALDRQSCGRQGISRGEIFGQAFMFVLAGSETTPAALHLVFYMLAAHEDIQRRCREEILRLCGYEKEISYELLSEMRYLDQCIAETLRMYPPVVRTSRLCTKDIIIKGIKLKRGCIFTIPIRAIHYAEEFYPNSNVFDPDRWTSCSRLQRDPLTYLPFGHGPRNCIGMRVAQMQMKTALAHILRRYEMVPEKILDLPLKIDSIGSMRTVEQLNIVFTRI
ncbi:unspecific monooxygenase [Dictyocaulus viviparus]|uniref:Unspecific monooxygenase n=1 Tax=Dictyocaulus viviparus TaxID=29172 RepID=A0A0D8XEL2_DICVI|nr:unspecific monooxygenase [Dictyocaulus viviparus]